MKYCVIIPNQSKHGKRDAFLWPSESKGEFIKLSDMATPHIFNALRVVYNHSVPPAFRVGKFIPYEDVFEWDDIYKANAYEALLKEYESRDDREYEDDELLRDIRANQAFLEEVL